MKNSNIQGKGERNAQERKSEKKTEWKNTTMPIVVMIADEGLSRPPIGFG